MGVCICLFRGFKEADSATHKFLTEGAQEGFQFSVGTPFLLRMFTESFCLHTKKRQQQCEKRLSIFCEQQSENSLLVWDFIFCVID